MYLSETGGFFSTVMASWSFANSTTSVWFRIFSWWSLPRAWEESGATTSPTMGQAAGDRSTWPGEHLSRTHLGCRLLAGEAGKGGVFLRKAMISLDYWELIHGQQRETRSAGSPTHQQSPIGENSHWHRPKVSQQILLFVPTQLRREVPYDESLTAPGLDRIAVLLCTLIHHSGAIS